MIGRGVSVVVLLAGMQSCTAVENYLKHRALDLADCVKLNVGVGVGLALDARITDWFAPGLGYVSMTTNVGWDDRKVNGIWQEWVVVNTPRAVWEASLGDYDEARTSPDYDATQSIGRLALASVFLANERWIRMPDATEITVEFYSLFNFAPVSTYIRAADPGRFLLEEGETAVVRHKGFWNQGWIEVGVTPLLLQARIGVNAFQIVDFALGVFGLDPAHDDRLTIVEPAGEEDRG